MAFSKLVKSPTLGQYIQVGTVSNGLQGYSRNWVTRTGVMPTILDITQGSDLQNRIKALPLTNFNSWHDLIYPKSKNEDLTNKINAMDSTALWLWGNIDDGGVSIHHISHPIYGGSWAFAVTLWWGYYENETQQWYRGTTLGSSYELVNDFQIAFYYMYQGFNETQVNNNGEFACYINNMSQSSFGHFNAVWIGTSPSYVQVDTVNDLLYLDNGGFQKSVTDNNYYPNNCIAYAYPTNGFRDDAIVDTPVSQGWTHISGTIFSGAIHQDPYNGGNGSQGGGGASDYDQDGVNPPDVTSRGILGTGILSLFNPSNQNMIDFANFLYSSLTQGDADALKKLFVNPMDYIICLNMTHLDISTNTSGTKVVHMGGIDTTVAMPEIVNQFVTYSGGSVTLQPQYNFTDYSPYTKLQIYIPYCGQHDLPIDLLQGGTLNLQYNVDLLSGSLTAILSVTRDRTSYMHNVEKPVNDFTTFTYTGNIYTPVPIGSVDNRQYVNSMISLASSSLTTLATGNPLPLLGMTANTAIASKQNVSRNGSIGSTMGFLANQQAFIIKSRPAVNTPDNYSMWKGYPANIFGKIGSFSELVKVDSDTLWTDKFTKDITDEESDELKQIVKDGIYIPKDS